MSCKSVCFSVMVWVVVRFYLFIELAFLFHVFLFVCCLAACSLLLVYIYVFLEDKMYSSQKNVERKPADCSKYNVSLILARVHW